MKEYNHLSQVERYNICMYLVQGFSKSDIAKAMNRSVSTIYRELERNKRPQNGYYAASVADSYAHGRLRRARRGSQYSADVWNIVYALLKKKWSPEQIRNHLCVVHNIEISIQTIYRHIKKDRRKGGMLYKSLRIMSKVRRKSYGSKDSRGRLEGKKDITTRPIEADKRLEIGHWEGDTVMGGDRKECVLTLVDRKSGYAFVEKLRARTAEETNYALNRIISKHREKFKTITFDNGTEFHSYKKIEERFGVQCYFAKPHHPWERGCNENFNGLLRQYLPKGKSMKEIGTAKLEVILQELNERPRKRHSFKSPQEVYLYGEPLSHL